MNILALDTSTEACSAALYLDGEIQSQYQLAPREHSRLILKMIDDLLKESNLSVASLDAIAFGRGPGSFMGLRIAAGVVQGIAFAHDIPVIPVSTLKAIAQGAFEETQNKYVLATIDARMDEVYWGAYTLDDSKPESVSWKLIDEECVISPEKIQLSEMLADKNISWVAAGSGWKNYADRILVNEDFSLNKMLPDCLPVAEHIVKLAVADLTAGNTVSAAEAIPVYLRNNVARKPKAATF
jgi:tRNA threonylcarbamoyladenosine biosynthesis protein TsaB